ncbi:MAG: hypothetical protein HPM95_14620 [Alphaproteobacteria bacterium]|nr:hypothetical protein [Alphaproteobacteria bacterium]
MLLVSGSPVRGRAHLAQSVETDASVDLVHFTILRPPNKQDGTPINELSLIAFPTREMFSVKIDEFDLIIFDRYVRRGVLPLLYFDNIARYVRDGGAVLVASGPDYADGGSIYRTPLSPVLPAEPTGVVYEEPFRAEISETGTRHPVTRDLPGGNATPPDWSRWFRLVEANVANAETLMNGANDKPLLVLGREGEGRVAVLLSDHVWLWARGYEGGGPHVALLRRLAHWLMKEPDLEEEALRLTSRGAEVVAERQTIGESVGDLVLTLPGGETRTLTPTEVAPGLWRANTPAPDLGLYTVDDGTRKALVHVGPPNPREFTDVLSTTATLASLSAETGGATAGSPMPAGIADAAGGAAAPRHRFCRRRMDRPAIDECQCPEGCRPLPAVPGAAWPCPAARRGLAVVVPRAADARAAQASRARPPRTAPVGNGSSGLRLARSTRAGSAGPGSAMLPGGTGAKPSGP